MKVQARRGFGKSASLNWLKVHVNFDGQECLPWPFSKSKATGIGRFGVNGNNYSAQNYMCELAHGPKPSAEHRAASICGGLRICGCVNPRHVQWRTSSEIHVKSNALKKERGVVWGGRKPKLQPEQIARIQSAGPRITFVTLAVELGVSETTIRNCWHRRADERSHPELKARRRLVILSTTRPRIIKPAKRALDAPRPTHPLLVEIGKLVPRVPGFEDIIQEIALAVCEGNTTLEQLQAEGVRPFMTAFRRLNFEQRGYSLSLDVPMHDGRSWYDVLPAD